MFLGGTVAVHYLALRAMLRIRGRAGRTALYYAWFVAAVLGFLVVRKYTWLTHLFLPGAERLLDRVNLVFSRGNSALPVVTLGLSFMIFRQIHMAIEVRDGVLKDFRLGDYLSYQFAFWTFLSGPIQRFEPFAEEFHRMASSPQGPPAQAVLLGLNRVMFGYLKMFVVGAWFFGMAKIETFTRHPDPGHLAAFLLAYPCYMYINFTGYCDIMIGLAAAVGFTLPENFHRPFLARNMVDYWNRWHITLSEFFRDYMYLPIYTALRKRGPRPLAISITSMLAFFVMGVWHDNTVMMAAFGLFHGIGVTAVNLYGEAMRKVLSREQLKKYRQSLPVRIVAVAVCQCNVVVAFLLFAYDWKGLQEVYQCILHGLS